jgi:hypothetical protein
LGDGVVARGLEYGLLELGGFREVLVVDGLLELELEEGGVALGLVDVGEVAGPAGPIPGGGRGGGGGGGGAAASGGGGPAGGGGGGTVRGGRRRAEGDVDKSWSFYFLIES